jgi:hypothetical protein
MAKCAAFRKRNANQDTVPLYLEEVVRMWPTPTANERANDTEAIPSQATLERFEAGEIARVRKTRAPTLTSAVLWPTPRAEDSAQTGAHGETADTLTSAVRLWPTPRADSGVSRKPGTGGRCLQEEAKKFPTPTQSDGMGGPGTAGRDGGENLRTTVGGSLNPLWVGWLMGFPIGFSDSAPLATRKSLCPPHSRFEYWLHCCRRMLEQLFPPPGEGD